MDKYITRTIERTFAVIAGFDTVKEEKVEKRFAFWGKFEEDYELFQLSMEETFIPYKVVEIHYETKKYKISVTDFVAFGKPCGDDE